MHELREHIGELEIAASAPTLSELFVEVARALAGVMSKGASGIEQQAQEEAIELEAPDRDALLVDWLNELIFQAETKKLVFTEFAIDASERKLRARVKGSPAREMRTDVKAATFHGLSITEGGDGFSA